MGNPLSHAFGQGTGAIVGARPVAKELAVERVLDKRYKILAPIGAGGSSQVYLAQDLVLGREVALKQLDPAAAADPSLRRMFVKEARALASLSHPGIVAVYDVGEADGVPYIVMEHLPGGSLKQRLERGGPLTPADAVRHAVEIANGLQFAHARGIVHADLKPSNILFDANDHAKICDFGIARTPQEEADTPQLFATALYVAPERVEGKSATTASDVYGLGLVLYEMLVGRPPFTSANAAVLLRDHVVRMPVPPSHLRPSLARELDTVVLRALAKQPNLRYPKASDMATALMSIENLDKELATTRFAGVMTDPMRDIVPSVKQSPVVALLSEYGAPLRRAFFALLAVLPSFALAQAAGLHLVATGVVCAAVVFLALGGHLGGSLAVAWVVDTALLFLFLPALAVLFALLGLWLWIRDVPPEQTAIALAMPVTTPFGLAPALVLTAASIEGLLGLATAAWGAVMTIVVGIAMGTRTYGPYAQTGFPLEQESLFSPARAAETKGALLSMLSSPSDRFGALATVLDPGVLWSQLAALVSRIAGADLTAIANVLAWAAAALTVWAVTRVLRTFFHTLLRRANPWFALYVLAQAAGAGSGASLLFLLFITWSPLASAPGRTAENVLLVSALVGAVIATALGVVISATERQDEADASAPPVAARRLPVR